LLRNRRTFKSVSFYALAGVLTCKYRVFGKPRINLPDFNSKTVQKIIELPGSLQIQIRQISLKALSVPPLGAAARIGNSKFDILIKIFTKSKKSK
jgi:hypothetical protein